MARQLWLLRHGDAESGDGDDAARRLTAKGEQQSRAAGRALAALDVGLGAVLTSPRVRARDTAALAAEPLDVEPSVHEPLTGGFQAGQAEELLASLDDDARLLIVGHEPDFSQIVFDLCGAKIDLKKGGIAAVRLTGSGRGELIALLRPRELNALAGSR